MESRFTAPRGLSEENQGDSEEGFGQFTQSNPGFADFEGIGNENSELKVNMAGFFTDMWPEEPRDDRHRLEHFEVMWMHLGDNFLPGHGIHEFPDLVKNYDEKFVKNCYKLTNKSFGPFVINLLMTNC